MTMTLHAYARSRAVSVFVVLVATIGLATSASAQWVDTWKSPNIQPIQPEPGRKLVALVIQPDEDNRRTSENVLADALTARGVRGVPSYTLLPPEELRNEALARKNFEAAGIAGVVVMRLVDVSTKSSYSPATWYSMPYYGTFWNGYYNYGWNSVISPGYVREDVIVSVETLVFDLVNDRLIWAGLSRTTNPKDANAFIRKLVADAVGKMRKDGVLAR